LFLGHSLESAAKDFCFASGIVECKCEDCGGEAADSKLQLWEEPMQEAGDNKEDEEQLECERGTSEEFHEYL
jgi:hypothetical protein